MFMKSVFRWLLIVCASVNIAFAAVKVGQKAPVFTLPSAQGKTVTLSEFPGKVIVLEWSNFDCPFVKKHYLSGNIPAMQKKYKEQGVVWLTIVSSAPGKQGFYDGIKLNDKAQILGNQANAVLIDKSGIVGKQFGAKTTPQFVIIDKQGHIAYHGAIDSIPSTDKADITKANNYVSAALDALDAQKPVKVSSTQPYGCSVKY